MSHSQDNLSKLRSQLAQLNTQLFELIKVREELTHELQKAKGSGLTTHYDAQREKQLFTDHKSALDQLSLRELAAFSLIMESQAGAPVLYPAWSEGAHLVGPSLGIESLINPLLLKTSHPNLFKSLKLKTDFSFLLSI
jgi:chorismate mutase